MLPESLVPRRNLNLIIEHPVVVLAVPNPSVKRLKCSWHLGMMMRIIETLLLKTQAYMYFCSKKHIFLQRPHHFPCQSP